MCNFITSLFKPKLTLPHPEEPRDFTQTAINTNVNQVLNKWLLDWRVPPQYDTYWVNAIIVHVYDAWPPEMNLPPSVPAATWSDGDKRYLAVLAPWLNAGVIAHEQAHNSYALLDADKRVSFSLIYNSLRDTDQYIKLLFSKNTYGLTSDIEGHAEMYRYLGDKVPAMLKQYYPKLY